MDGNRFDALLRVLAQGLTRRGTLRAAGVVGTGGLAAVGALGRTPLATQAKKKKKKKSCGPACPQGADYCLDDANWGCGLNCACATGSSRTICGRLSLDACIACTTDTQCELETGPGSVCGHSEVGECECEGKSRVCIPPCPSPIPVRCS